MPPPAPSRPAAPPRPTGSPTPGRAAAPSPATPPQKRVIKPRVVQKICPRIVFYAGEKFGKTTFGAHAPEPLLLMPKSDTGYDTLLGAGLVPQIPAETVDSWADLIGWTDSLIADQQGRETLILDGLGAFDFMCQTVVCERDFKGNWNDPKDGFLAYGAERGYKAAAIEWRKLLSRLDSLNQRGMMVVLLGHAMKVPFRNPLGADYDTYTADANRHSWEETKRWSDCILFGKFYTVIDAEKKGKGKGIGGTDRVIYTEQRDAFSAGNRYGMAPELWLPENTPGAAWSTVWNEITRNKNAAAE